MARDENVKIFQDTEERVKKDPGLQEAVKHSVAEQVLIPEMMEVTGLMPELAQNRDRYEKDAEIIVSKKRSYEAAAGYPGERVCVHNFASATNPGGGVTKGSSAQEECLCRCSTLYFCLNTKEMWAGFYSPHRYAQDPIHNDDCIYTPKVIVFKSDTATPAPLPESDWYSVNVITCAAPNLRLLPANGMNPGDGNKTVKMTRAQQQALHEKRLTRILDVAVAGGNEVVILGAFGCGAFENDPEAVAAAFSHVIARYRRCFKTIELAIYCSPRDERDAEIIVSKKRSYEAAAGYPGERVCVHNFASATNPGGGVTKGSSAQEECLCRCSTLYFCLNTKEMWAGFYSPHRYAQDPIHNDDCIYTPKVIVFKSDTATPAPLPESDWYSVNVITCAAPNLRLLPANGMNPGDGNKTVKMTRAQQQALHEKRLTRILDVAVAGGNEVVILGAFGCGAFENDPEAVAAAFSHVIARYRRCFKTIELAIYCSPRDERNYNIFKHEIDTTLC